MVRVRVKVKFRVQKYLGFNPGRHSEPFIWETYPNVIYNGSGLINNVRVNRPRRVFTPKLNCAYRINFLLTTSVCNLTLACFPGRK